MCFIGSTCTALPLGGHWRCEATRNSPDGVMTSSAAAPPPATAQGLTLVHVRAQLEQLQDTFMS
jgi:hypothetical protein